jgi:mitogen-activated protein kinase binding protein 1
MLVIHSGVGMSFQMTARFQPPDGQSNMKLSKIIGQTSLSNACFAQADNGLFVYAAGCVAILYNPKTNKQLSYFKVSRAISCLALTQNGLYLAIGERGHLPSITIWDTRTVEKCSILTGHQHGIGVMRFSLDSEYLVSIGFKTDKQLIIWDWKEGKQTCSTAMNKLENKVNSIDFHSSGQFFVTCGDNHLKWWYVIKDTHPVTNRQYVKGVNGRPASILDIHRGSHFVDIICPSSSSQQQPHQPQRIDAQSISANIYTLSATGVLCLLHETRLMDRWVQVDTTKAYALALTNSSHLLVGCTNGRILIFSAFSLEYLSSLPLPFPLSGGGGATKYPACYSLCPLSQSSHVVSTYADRSMFIWDLTDISQPIKLRSFVGHSACIWDLQFLHPQTSSDSGSSLPSNTFFTCGADDLIHIWNIDPKLQRTSRWKSSSSRDLLHSLSLNVNEQQGAFKSSTVVDDNLDLSCPSPDFELPDRQQVGLWTLLFALTSLRACIPQDVLLCIRMAQTLRVGAKMALFISSISRQ